MRRVKLAMINALVRCHEKIRRPAVKQDNKAKQNRGNEVSVEAPQDTGDLGRRRWKVPRVGLTVGLVVGDKISHYCVLQEEAEGVERGKLKTTPAALQPWLEALPAGTRVVLETGTHSSWISPLSLAFQMPERSSPSRVRCAAPPSRALDVSGPFRTRAQLRERGQMQRHTVLARGQAAPFRWPGS